MAEGDGTGADVALGGVCWTGAEVVAKATGAGVALTGGVEIIVAVADAAGGTVAVAPQANAAIANNPGINSDLRVNMFLFLF